MQGRILPLTYGLYNGWFFSLAPRSILSVAHCKTDRTTKICKAYSSTTLPVLQLTFKKDHSSGEKMGLKQEASTQN